MALLPVGVKGNQESIQQSVAANIVLSVMGDLRGTLLASSTTTVTGNLNSRLYEIPIPSSNSPLKTTLYLKESGARDGQINNSNPDHDARYRVDVNIIPPAASTDKFATMVQILITWPALADPNPAMPPSKYSGSYEVVSAFNRN